MNGATINGKETLVIRAENVASNTLLAHRAHGGVSPALLPPGSARDLIAALQTVIVIVVVIATVWAS